MKKKIVTKIIIEWKFLLFFIIAKVYPFYCNNFNKKRVEFRGKICGQERKKIIIYPLYNMVY